MPAVTHKKYLKIQCGVLGEGPSENLFWPVLEAVELPLQWNPPAQYSLIFTSKIAVKLFFKNYFNPKKDIEFIGAVGNSTKKSIQIELENTLGGNHSIKILTPAEEGLEHLLRTFPLTANSSAFILTALEGNTATTLEILQKEGFPFHCIMAPIYNLQDCNSSFLKTLFEDEPLCESYVFCCRSGKVLERTLAQLYTFFSCARPEELPSSLKFAVEKKSTLQKACDLGLESRIFKGKPYDKQRS